MTPGLLTLISPSVPVGASPASVVILTETLRQGGPTERNFPEESRRTGVLRGQMATARVASARP